MIWDTLSCTLRQRGDPRFDEAADICEELASELDSLVVAVLGIHTAYQKGLLSGWR